MDDVTYNAQIGSAELGNDIATWRGSYILAFSAYNAGPRRAKEWIEQYGDPRDPKVDPIDWIERIPISETRNYVAARDREHAGLSRDHREQSQAHDRGRLAPRRVAHYHNGGTVKLRGLSPRRQISTMVS